MRMTILLIGLLVPTTLIAQRGARCGSDRWSVKTLTDAHCDSISSAVEPTSVAFWDDDHGQVGNATNGIELHPVLLVVPILTKNDILRMEVGADPPDTTEIRVWLNLRSRVYHCPGAAAYGTTKDGEFMPESAAVNAGGRPAGGRRCR